LQAAALLHENSIHFCFTWAHWILLQGLLASIFTSHGSIFYRHQQFKETFIYACMQQFGLAS